MDFTVRFRPFRMEDAGLVNALRQVDTMEKMIGGSRRPVSLERDAKWVEDIIMKDDPRSVFWALTELDSEEIIGYNSIANIDLRNGTCAWGGIKIDARYSGKGYGQQVGLKNLQFAFEELRMVRISAECQEHHTVVVNMMQKIGYQKEGLMRNTLFKNGVSNNQWLMSVTDTDYFDVIKPKFQL